MVACCLLAGTEVALIVQIHSVGDGIEAACLPQFLHHCEQFIFAKKTAPPIVTHILRPIEFRGGDHFQRNRLFPRKINRIGKLGACQAGRIGNDRQHIGAQCLMCGPGEVSGIHPAGIGDENAAQSM